MNTRSAPHAERSAVGYVHRDMTIPDNMGEKIDDYISKGLRPGHFLQAIISNDLGEACARADHNNVQILPAYAIYFYNEAPAACWGSKEKMEAWIASFPGEASRPDHAAQVVKAMQHHDDARTIMQEAADSMADLLGCFGADDPWWLAHAEECSTHGWTADNLREIILMEARARLEKFKTIMEVTNASI